MSELEHRVRGVDHTAFPTFDPAATVRFYHEVLGFPIAHTICTKGWGPEAHPDFIHFFFDIGHGDRIAFFYRRRLDASDWPCEMQVQHETIESIYVHDPNGYFLEFTYATRPLGEADQRDAGLTIRALPDVVAEPEPTMAKLWARKADLIVSSAATESAEKIPEEVAR